MRDAKFWGSARRVARPLSTGTRQRASKRGHVRRLKSPRQCALPVPLPAAGIRMPGESPVITSLVGIEDGRYWKTCRRLPQESHLPGVFVARHGIEGSCLYVSGLPTRSSLLNRICRAAYSEGSFGIMNNDRWLCRIVKLTTKQRIIHKKKRMKKRIRVFSYALCLLNEGLLMHLTPRAHRRWRG